MNLKVYRGDAQALYSVIKGLDQLIENRPEDSLDARILRRIREFIIVWALDE